MPHASTCNGNRFRRYGNETLEEIIVLYQRETLNLQISNHLSQPQSKIRKTMKTIHLDTYSLHPEHI